MPPRYFPIAPLLRVCVAAVALACSIVAGGQGPSPRRGADEVRALWVTRTTMASPTTIAQMVKAAQDGGFNTLIVQIRGRGDAYYRSTLEPRAGELNSRPDFDPLAEALTLGRRAGMRVHAWLVVNLVSSAFELPASRQHLVYRQPEWLMVPREVAADIVNVDPRSPEYVGRLARWTRAHSNDVEGLYLSPAHPGATAHLAKVVSELVERYPVDGVHLDYARYPNNAFDYSPIAIQQFKQVVRGELTEVERRTADAQEAIDPLAYPNLFGPRWQGFLRSRQTAVIMRLRTIAKGALPNAVLSAAVVADLEQAHDTRFQDWRTWLDQGLIDVLVPMAYATEASTFEDQITVARDLAGDRPVWAGIGAYRLSQAETLQRIATARKLNVAGVALFSYESLVTPPNSLATLAEIGRAAFGTGSR